MTRSCVSLAMPCVWLFLLGCGGGSKSPAGAKSPGKTASETAAKTSSGESKSPADSSKTSDPGSAAKGADLLKRIVALEEEADFNEAFRQAMEARQSCKDGPEVLDQLDKAISRLRDEKKLAIEVSVAIKGLEDPEKRDVASAKLMESGDVGKLCLRRAVLRESGAIAAECARLLVKIRDAAATKIFVERLTSKKDLSPPLVSALGEGLKEMAGAGAEDSIPAIYSVVKTDPPAYRDMVPVLVAAARKTGNLSPAKFNLFMQDPGAYQTLMSHDLLVEGIAAYWKFDEPFPVSLAADSATGKLGAKHVKGVRSSAEVPKLSFANPQCLGFDGVSGFARVEGKPFADIADDFTVAFWAEPSGPRAETPEKRDGTDGMKGQRYAVCPSQGTSVYGQGHAIAGVSVGTNGVSVFEHAESCMPSVVVHNVQIKAWTHIAVVYSKKAPKLFVNGAPVKTGQASAMTVHPGHSFGGDGANPGYYAGRLDDLRIYKRALDDDSVRMIGMDLLKRP